MQIANIVAVTALTIALCPVTTATAAAVPDAAIMGSGDTKCPSTFIACEREIGVAEKPVGVPVQSVPERSPVPGVSSIAEITGTRLYGINFGPFLNGEDPTQGSVLSEAQLRARLALIQDDIEGWVRTFGSTDGLENVAAIARASGFNTAIQAWLGPDRSANAREVESLIRLGQAGLVDIAILGSETLLRDDLSEAELIDYIDQVKAALPEVQVTTADTYSSLLDHPAVIDVVDVVLVNIYPYWDGSNIDRALADLVHAYNRVVAASGGKGVVIAETGWPSCGDTICEAVPSPENARAYLRDFVNWAQLEGVAYFYFAAFDEAWKAAQEGPQGACWGIRDSSGQLKPDMQGSH